MGVVRVACAIVAVLVLAAAGEAASPPPDRLRPTRPTIDGAPETPYLRPVFHFGARDNRTPPSQIRFRCGIDTPLLHPCARVYQPFSALAFGQHVLRVRATDRAGNTSRLATARFAVVGTWDAAADFPQAPRPENPAHDQYGNTTWFYLYSGTTAHDPSDYRALPVFTVVDPNNQGWRSTAAPFPNGVFVGWGSGQISMGPGHYALGQNAILGWRSAVASSIKLQATIWQDQPSCGVPQNGIIWSIDQGAKTLQSEPLAPGEKKHVALTTTVTAGESLYLIVDGNGDTNCDGTLVDLTLLTQ